MLACFPLCTHILDGVEPPLPHLVSQKNILCFGLSDAALSESCLPGCNPLAPTVEGAVGEVNVKGMALVPTSWAAPPLTLM